MSVPPPPSSPLSAERIAALLSRGEDQWFERKSGRIAPRDLAETLVALANAEGGTVAVGLHAGQVDGVADDRANPLRQAAQDFTVPVVRAEVEEFQDPQGARILVYRVAPSQRVHETAKGDCFLRVGDESVRLRFTQRQELEHDRGPEPFDGTPSGAGLEDLDPAQVESYRTTLGASTPEGLLRARNLLTPRGEVTVAGYLLLSEHPQERYPNAHVRVLRYLEDERGTGAGQSLAADGDIRCEGPLPQQIEQATRTIAQMMPARRALTESGRFEALPLIPQDVWLEGLVNAVVHRSYSLAGDHVRVEIFPSRMEITSPGRFPGLADPSDPQSIGRHARNPRIARVCADLGITQELGEGIRRMFVEMRRRGLTDPLYTQSPSAVRLVLSSADSVPEAVRSAVGKGAMATLDAMRLAGRPLGTGQVAELTGRSRPTVLRHLHRLREEGLVSWEGESAKDPRARWAVRGV